MNPLPQEFYDRLAIRKRHFFKEIWRPPRHWLINTHLAPPRRQAQPKTCIGGPVLPLPAQITNAQIWPTEVVYCPICILLLGNTWVCLLYTSDAADE